MKRIKYDFLKFWQKWRILQRMKMKILNVKFLAGNASFLIPLKETENRFSIFCLVCATEQSQESTYGENHWVTLNLF